MIMNKQQAIEVASAYFPSYPSVDEFHVTADGQVFEVKSFAEAHATSIAKQDGPVVITVSRHDLASPEVKGKKADGKTK